MKLRGPRRSRRRARAAHLAVSLYELQQPAEGGSVAVEPAAPVVDAAAPVTVPDCCAITRARRVTLGATVMVISTHRADCGGWGP
ncbi:hypothetical protein ACFVUH_08240 [Kitasatospora sp. NPDC058032]|uniref:hypothetical protein n=1 Tax=Kitasatospora sp. NPDC058032 TaxID=3346307 RepID=UPI0036D8030F